MVSLTRYHSILNLSATSTSDSTGASEHERELLVGLRIEQPLAAVLHCGVRNVVPYKPTSRSKGGGAKASRAHERVRDEFAGDRALSDKYLCEVNWLL